MLTDSASISMYELDNIGKEFPKGSSTVIALENVSLSIPRAAMVSVQGPTGGGKSTLLQILGGLERPTTGSVTLNGTEISSLRDGRLSQIRAESIGFVFQNYNLIPTLSAVENVQTALVPTKISNKEAQHRALRALESVNLLDRAHHLPGELSGGQQQRVAIARALVKNPEVILADEPTGNLDEQTRDDIIGLLEGLAQDQGITVIVVTHDSTVAKRAQIHLRIDNGKLETL